VRASYRRLAALVKGLRNFKKGVNDAEEDIEEAQVEEIPKYSDDNKSA